MTIFSKKDNKIETLNARETAPGAATEDMYHGDDKLSEKGTHIIILILYALDLMHSVAFLFHYIV